MTKPYRPIWLNPSTDAMLSNKRAANQTTDAVSLTTRHSHPTGNPPGLFRVVTTRTAVQGVPAAPQTLLDSGFIGNVSSTALPYTTSVGGVTAPIGPNGAVVTGGRLYVAIADKKTTTTDVAVIYSAPISGVSIGAWRRETAPEGSPYVAEFCDPGSMVAIGGWMYLMTNWTTWSAQIGSDGTLSGWNDAVYNGPWPYWYKFGYGIWSYPGDYGQALLMGGYETTGWQGSSATGFLYVVDNAGVVYRYFTDTNGNIYTDTASHIVQSGTLPAVRYYAAVHVDDSGYLYVLGGETSGGSPQTSVYYRAANVSTDGLLTSTWQTSSRTLTAARSRMAYAAVYASSTPRSATPGQPATIYILGGIATSGGAAQSTIYSMAADTIRGGAGSWTTASHALSTAIKYGGAAALNQGVGQEPPYSVDGSGKKYIVVLGGGVTLPMLARTDDSASVASGTSSSLSSSGLGSNAAVVTNDDATVDITWQLFGFGGTAADVLADGDEIQIGVQTTDFTTGDPSDLAVVTLRIGQAPTATSLSPASSASLTTGTPKLSWKYTAGAGGGQQATWRVRLYDNGSVLVYDSGVQRSLTNAVMPDLRPYLNQIGTAPFRMQVDLASTDLPIVGASASGTATSTGLTIGASAPSTPTSVTATPSPSNGWVTVAWTNPGGSTAATNRVWRRLAGTTTWELLKSGVVAVVGSQQSVNLMDQVAFGVAYDYTVSAATAALMESAKATAASSVTLNPTTTFGTGYRAMLHVAGAGTTAGNAVGIFLAEPPQLPRTIDATSALGFGNAAPSQRYGPAYYRTLRLRLLHNQATRDALQALLVAAQQGGLTLCYRDLKGYVLYVGLDSSRDLTAGIYYQEGLTLIETQFTYVP